MKGMQKIKRGNGFRGVLSYVLNRDGIESGALIGGNMSGKNARELAREFGLVRALRPDALNPVWHNSLRLTDGEYLDNDQWNKLADDYMNRMGFSEYHPRIYVLHDDPNGQHIHILASRISLKSELFLGKNENLISTKIISKLESDYGLKITKGADYFQNENIIKPKLKTLSKNEIEMSIRLDQQPPRLFLQDSINMVLKNKPTIKEFIESLELLGIYAVPNIASTGRMNGFSFQFENVNFKASQLGDGFKWSRLQEQLQYEQTRDSAFLAAVKSTRTAAIAVATGTEVRGPGEQSSGWDGIGANSDEAGTLGPDAHHADRTGRTNDSGTKAFADYGQSGVGGNTGIDAIHERRNERTSIGDKDTTQTVEKQSGGRGPKAQLREESPERDVQGATTKTLTLNTSDSDSDGDSDLIIDRLISLASTGLNSPDLEAKKEAWRNQSAALDAPSYRITLIPRQDKDASGRRLIHKNIGKTDSGEVFFTAQQVERLLPRLRMENARGFDVYVTPIDEAHHYLVVDDVTKTNLDLLLDGTFKHCLVQCSSENNFQVVLKARAEKSLGKFEQSAANSVVQNLNRQYGDKNFSGVIHPFRLAGFSNKKSGRSNAFTRIVDAVKQVCETTSKMIMDAREQLRRDVNEINASAAKNVVSTLLRTKREQPLNEGDLASSFLRYHREVEDHAIKAGWNLDTSRVDFGACRRLLSDGYEQRAVIDALLAGSPMVKERHKNPLDYALRTVIKAQQRNDEELAKLNSKKAKHDKKPGI